MYKILIGRKEKLMTEYLFLENSPIKDQRMKVEKKGRKFA